MARPLVVLRKLFALLRDGGRLFVTMQRYGDDCTYSVRPGEPIYVGPYTLQRIPKLVHPDACHCLHATTEGVRYFMVLEKRAASSSSSS